MSSSDASSAAKAARRLLEEKESVSKWGGRNTLSFRLVDGQPVCTSCEQSLVVTEQTEAYSARTGRFLPRYKGTCQCDPDRIRTYVPSPKRKEKR